MEKEKKAYRSKDDRIILGVCGGMADYFDVNPTIVRLIFILLALAEGLGIIIYFVLALMLKEDPGENKAGTDRKENARDFIQDVLAGTKKFIDHLRWK